MILPGPIRACREVGNAAPTWALALGAGDGNRTRTISLGICTVPRLSHGLTCGSGCPRVTKRGPDHEQDAEQNRNQQDRGRKALRHPERYTAHSGPDHANIAGPWCASPSSDLRITSVYGPLVSGLASV